jgi:hypothetical protein
MPREEAPMETFSFTEFMMEGGWGMWPVLVLGLVMLASSVRYMASPERFCLPFIAALWVTLVVTVVHATVTDVAAVLHHLEEPSRAPDGLVARMLMMGLKESTRPAALGGIFLTLAPLFVAGGIYREWAASRRTAA